MINYNLLNTLTAALERFQQAFRVHDHPNLARENHLHNEYALTASIRSDNLITLNSVGGVLNVDLSLGTNFYIDLVEDVTTINYINVDSNNVHYKINFIIHQNASTSFTFKTDNYLWDNGIDGYLPISTQHNAIDFLTIDAYPSMNLWIASILKDVKVPI